jgi:hypothetical protein
LKLRDAKQTGRHGQCHAAERTGHPQVPIPRTEGNLPPRHTVTLTHCCQLHDSGSPERISQVPQAKSLASNQAKWKSLESPLPMGISTEHLQLSHQLTLEPWRVKMGSNAWGHDKGPGKELGTSQCLLFKVNLTAVTWSGHWPSCIRWSS